MSPIAKQEIDRRLLLLIVLVLCSILFFAGFYPFNFFSPNRAVHRHDGGLSFSQWSIAHTDRPLEGPGNMLIPQGELTIDLWMEPAGSNNDLSRILCLVDASGGNESLAVGQWKESLHAETFDILTGDRIAGKVVARNTMKKGAGIVASLTAGRDGLTLYIDGQMKQHVPARRQNEAPPGPLKLILGNSADGRHQWNGRIRGFALYNSVLPDSDIRHNYENWLTGKASPAEQSGGPAVFFVFQNEPEGMVLDRSGNGNNLVIPKTFRPLRRNLPPNPVEEYRLSGSYMRDAALNIMGFIPFAFFTAFYFRAGLHWKRGHSITAAVLFGLCISLTIEYWQTFLPGRNPSMTDIITNTLGSVIGALLILPLYKRQDEDRG